MQKRGPELSTAMPSNSHLTCRLCARRRRALPHPPLTPAATRRQPPVSRGALRGVPAGSAPGARRARSASGGFKVAAARHARAQHERAHLPVPRGERGHEGGCLRARAAGPAPQSAAAGLARHAPTVAHAIPWQRMPPWSCPCTPSLGCAHACWPNCCCNVSMRAGGWSGQ